MRLHVWACRRILYGTGGSLDFGAASPVPSLVNFVADRRGNMKTGRAPLIISELLFLCFPTNVGHTGLLFGNASNMIYLLTALSYCIHYLGTP